MQHKTLSDGVVVVGGDITFWSNFRILSDGFFCKVSARASYEIMSRSFCCLRETETTDESRCDFNVDVVRGFWRRWQRPGRAAAERQTDRLFSISLHGQHTLCRCFLSLQAHTLTDYHTHFHTQTYVERSSGVSGSRSRSLSPALSLVERATGQNFHSRWARGRRYLFGIGTNTTITAPAPAPAQIQIYVLWNTDANALGSVLLFFAQKNSSKRV